MRSFGLAILLTAGCAAPAHQTVEDQAYESRAEAAHEHEQRSADKSVYKGLYENEKAVRRYCGEPTADEETGQTRWPDDCYARLLKIFWSRLQMHYKYADWDEVMLWCEGYPDRCDSPEGIERLVRHSNGKASHDQLQQDLANIEADRTASHAEIERQEHEAFVRATERAIDYFEFGDSDCILTSTSSSSADINTTPTGATVRGTSAGTTKVKCRKTPR